MDWQWIATAALGVVSALLGVIIGMIGYIVKSLHESVAELQRADKESQVSQKELTEKVHKIETLVLGDYVRSNDFKDFSTVIFAKLDNMRSETKEDILRMERKLDGKQDKG